MTGPESAEQAAASTASLRAGGLPSEATGRLEQLRRTASWTSDLSVSEFAAVKEVGFEPVGQVMGSTVDVVGWSGWGSCGVNGFRSQTPTRVAGTGGSRTSWVGYPELVKALYAARRRALGRLEQECVALGGDGVVGVHLTLGGFPGIANSLEFQAIGTAVRARGRQHPTRPFLSDLSGQDFAKLLHAGWVPCGLVFGVAVGVRHDGYQTQGITRSWANGEVPAYTELVHQVRAQVRTELAADVARHGGHGVVLQDMTLRVWEQGCRQVQSGRDHVAETTVVGTAITPFRRTSVATHPHALTILRLDQQHATVVSRHLTDREQP